MTEAAGTGLPPNELELVRDIRARRAAGIPDLGEEMRRRIEDFGAVRIDTDVRREAFSELAAPFEVAPYRLVVRPESAVDRIGETVTLYMMLLDMAAEEPPGVVGFIERTFHFAEAQVNHALMTITAPYRGRAIAPRIMLASFARYDLLGMTTVTVHAALEAGRFYWSGKVGFDFLGGDDQRHVERWATFVLGALGLPIDLDGISRPQQWALLGTTSDPSPTARFSELALRVDRVSSALLDPYGGGTVGSSDTLEAEIEPGMVDLQRHLRAVAEANKIDWDADVPLGKLIMLSGPDWFGSFDLTDPVGRSAYQANATQAIAAAATSKASGR